MQEFCNDIEIVDEEITREYLISPACMEELYGLRFNEYELQLKLIEYTDKAKEFKIPGWRKLFTSYCKSVQVEQNTYNLGNLIEFKGQPLELKCGEWEANDGGISKMVGEYPVEACCHPIMPVERLVNIDTGTEKMRIAFKKGHMWRNLIADKKTIASTQAILELANNGIAVNSENAKYLIKYLHDIEHLNYSIIPERKSVGRLGWIEDYGFSPFIEDVAFDGEAQYKSFFESVKQNGDFDRWLELTKSIRTGKYPARIILAASFASVLVKPMQKLPFFVHLWGGTEVGKAQPLDTKIITPNGYKLMGDIVVNDLVIGSDGKPHKVIGIYPQGKKEVYELSFSDGTTTKCCKEHLWTVTTRTRRNHKRGYTVLSLEEMLKRPIKGSKGYTYRIPVCKPVEYDSAEMPYIPPYVMGALIGDGCLTLKQNPANGTRTIYFSNTEEDVIQRVEADLAKINVVLRRNTYTQCQYTAAGDGNAMLKNEIMRIGLNCKSAERFIPQCYKKTSIQGRRELLAGLFDTDGSISDTNGSYVYATKSIQLAHDVQELCRSLGYRATVRNHSRQNEYSVCIMTDEAIYYSEKHKQRHQLHIDKRQRSEDKQSMAIVSVKRLDSVECQCIMVDSEEHTYLCDDFIVTHNTVGLMLAASVWANPEVGRYIHSFNSTAVGREKSAAFVNSLPLILDELQVAKSDKGQFDRDIYSLSEGTGRTRGTRNGGIEKNSTWANCILTNGEMPITNSASGGGAVNRILEIECKEKLFDNPQTVADTVRENYGFAGKMFIESLNKDETKAVFDGFYSDLIKNDTTEKQAMAAALVLTADTLATEYIFQDGQALTEENIVEFLSSAEAVSVNARGYQYILEWISKNRLKLCGSSDRIEVLGKLNDTDCYIMASVFNSICEEGGFSTRPLLSYMKEKGLIETERGRNQVNYRVNGITQRCIKILLPDGSGNIETDLPW